MRASWPQQILLGVIAAAVGAIFGIAGTIAHAFTFGVVPVGLLLALIGCAALLVGLRLLFPHRWIAWIGGLGMLAALLLFSGQGPGGSVVVPQPAEGEFPIGIVWTYAVTGVVLLICAWPDLSRMRMTPRPSAGDRGASGDDSSRTRRIVP